MDLEKIRKKLHKIFHEPATHKARVTNGVISFLILISIAIIPIHFISRANGMTHVDNLLVIFDKIIVTIFTIEYLLRVWSSKNPRKFILSWESVVDIASIIPFYLDKFGFFSDFSFAFETFLLLRAIRILRFVNMYGIESEVLAKMEGNKNFYKIPGEKIERIIQRHPIILMAGMILPLVFTSMALTAIIISREFDWNAWGIASSILFFSLAILFFIKAWIDHHYDVIYITTHRVILQNHELFGSETNGLMYNAITNVVPSNKGFWRWALGIGHIEIETANRDGTISFKSVRHPHKVVAYIAENKLKARKRDLENHPNKEKLLAQENYNFGGNKSF